MLKVERNEPYDVNSVFEKKEFTRNGYTLRYRLYIPRNYDCGEMYPLVLFLHGAGERGSDNEKQMTVALPTIFADPSSPVYDSIVMAPQCPEGRQWVASDYETGTYSIADTPETAVLENTLAALDEVIKEYNVDVDRIYVTGISMGGYGTWDLLSRHGARFAAGMPICGGGDPSYAKLLKRIPIRTFHGNADPAVPVSGTRKMFASIRKAGGENISYTEFDGWSHNVWDKAYSDTSNFVWMFEQSLVERKKEAEKKSKIKKLATAGGVAGVLVSLAVFFLGSKKNNKKKNKK